MSKLTFSQFLESKEAQFFATGDSMHDPDDDTVAILVKDKASIDLSDEDFASYHGVQVIFGGDEVKLGTYDSRADEQAKNYRTAIIKAAWNSLSDEEKELLLVQ